MIDKLKIEYILLNQVIPNEYNPKILTEKEARDLEKSIKEFGVVDPLIINDAEGRKGVLIGGHQRLKIYQRLGFLEVPVIKLNIPDIEKEKELCLRLSKNTGSWDYDLLANFGEDELLDYGFESEELDKVFLGEATEDDFDAESEYVKIKEPTIKQGEIYQLGNHRLGCLDATKREDVEKLMGGEKADMVWTDPPYSILGSSTGFVQDINLIKPFFRLWIPNLPYFTNGDVYICCDWRTYPLIQSFSNEDLKLKNCIVWYKMAGGLGMAYQGAYELLTYFRTKKVNKIKGINVWEIRREKETGHYAQKPIEYISRAIKNSSERDEIILDLFGGSGSTLISAEKEGRKCFMMEIDERYCQVILNRFEKFTGLKAIKI